MTAVDETQTAPEGAPEDPQPAVVWWAVETTGAAEGSTETYICQTVDDLAELVARSAATAARVEVVAVTPADLARVHLDHARTPAAPSAPPARDLRRLPSVEVAATWSATEWLTFLDQEKVTKTRALRDLSRAAGRTVGFDDIEGRPDLAAVLLAFAAGPGEG